MVAFWGWSVLVLVGGDDEDDDPDEEEDEDDVDDSFLFSSRSLLLNNNLRCRACAASRCLKSDLTKWSLKMYFKFRSMAGRVARCSRNLV
jgi:hypothetical protein